MTPKQSDDLRDCRDCLCLASRRAARIITREFDRHLRSNGIRSTQFSMLVALIEGGPASIGELAGALEIERTTLSRNLSVLERRGWVTIAVAGRDARARIVRVTTKGRRAVSTALPAWRRAQNAAAGAVGRSGLAALHALSGVAFG